MAKVVGQIESLKRIKTTLGENGIQGFHSTGDIKAFIKHYDVEKQAILDQIRYQLDVEIQALEARQQADQKQFEDLRREQIQKLNGKILKQKSRCDFIRSKHTSHSIRRLYDSLQVRFFETSNALLEKNFNAIIQYRTSKANNQITKTLKELSYLVDHKAEIVSSRSNPLLQNLEQTKQVFDSLNPLMAGAVGEHLVSRELEKLSDKFILFNDFSLVFERPIPYKEQKSIISSIQIDHLLVSNAGIFIVETKNWSRKSINGTELRSPIDQVRRTNYALFSTLIKSKELDFKLNKHHWGKLKIPIRNIVAMINNKPKEKFKYVQVLTLQELNGYIQYFEPIFNDMEVETIANYLKRIKSR